MRKGPSTTLLGVVVALLATALLVALVPATLFLTKQGDRGATNRELIDRQTDANLARCAAISAVIQSGKRTILNDARPGDVDYAARKKAADKYSSFISREVELVTGKPLIINRDGSLNCPALGPDSPQVPRDTRVLPKRP